MLGDTLVVEVLNRAARQCGVKAPSSWVTATRDDHVSIRDDFLIETVADILDRFDFAAPIANSTTFTVEDANSRLMADGSRWFPMNPEMRRLQRHPLAVYDVGQQRPVLPVSDDAQWTHLVTTGASGASKYYQLRSFPGEGQLYVYPAPGVGETIKVHYVSEKWIRSGALGDYTTTGKLAFTDDADILALPADPVTAGIVWRYRERQGLPFMDKYNEYEAKLARMSNDSRSRRVVNMGQRKDVRWQDLIPVWIPPS
jgi:hypothetical protein